MATSEISSNMRRVLSKKEVGLLLNVAPRSLEDKRFRQRIGLPAVKIGHRIGFKQEDVERVIRRGREQLFGGEKR